MVAKISTGKTMRGALHYNEQKVAAGTAKILSANQFGLAGHGMSLSMKLAVFNGYTTRNRKAKTNVVHISLNFHPKENLDENKLTRIAREYMRRIGFDAQPYLVYHHFDAAHPHLHIVSTNITHEGKRIPLHNIGRTLSEKARTEIEHEFGLMKASEGITKEHSIPMTQICPLKYGRDGTKQGIAKVLHAVMQNYKFISIHQLNAVLRCYNVLAIEGSEGSAMRKRGGLLYSVLDQKGKPVGVPLKASSLQGKPTLKKLRRLFDLNSALREAHKAGLQNRINTSLSTRPCVVQDLISSLERQRVYTIVRKNAEGRIYGFTFIDQNTGCVFNGSELGKSYSAGQITKAFMEVQMKHSSNRPLSARGLPDESDARDHQTAKAPFVVNAVGDLLGELVRAEQLDHGNYNPLIQKKPKRKRRSI